MTVESKVKNTLHNYLAKARGAYTVEGLADACYKELKEHLKAENIPVVNEPDLGKVLTDGTASGGTVITASEGRE